MSRVQLLSSVLHLVSMQFLQSAVRNGEQVSAPASQACPVVPDAPAELSSWLIWSSVDASEPAPDPPDALPAADAPDSFELPATPAAASLGLDPASSMPRMPLHASRT